MQYIQYACIFATQRCDVPTRDYVVIHLPKQGINKYESVRRSRIALPNLRFDSCGGLSTNTNTTKEL